jgi:hypothetical protein
MLAIQLFDSPSSVILTGQEDQCVAGGTAATHVNNDILFLHSIVTKEFGNIFGRRFVRKASNFRWAIDVFLSHVVATVDGVVVLSVEVLPFLTPSRVLLLLAFETTFALRSAGLVERFVLGAGDEDQVDPSATNVLFVEVFLCLTRLISVFEHSDSQSGDFAIGVSADLDRVLVEAVPVEEFDDLLDSCLPGKSLNLEAWTVVLWLIHRGLAGANEVLQFSHEFGWEIFVAQGDPFAVLVAILDSNFVLGCFILYHLSR